MMFTSEFKDEAADYTNVWIMGEPFLKAYYTIYSLADEKIGLVRVADATHDRYNVVDDTRHNYKCTREESKDTNLKTRVTKCGSFASCYDNGYKNNKCVSKYESCGKFNDGTIKQGCIISDHCGVTASYFDKDDIKFECPDGVKEIHYHQPLGFMFNYESSE